MNKYELTTHHDGGYGSTSLPMGLTATIKLFRYIIKNLAGGEKIKITISCK